MSLAISNKIALGISGKKLEITSEPGHGTMVTFYIINKESNRSGV